MPATLLTPVLSAKAPGAGLSGPVGKPGQRGNGAEKGGLESVGTPGRAIAAVTTARGEEHAPPVNKEVVKACGFCNGPFVPIKPNQKFCQDKCKYAAWFERDVRKAAIKALDKALALLRQEASNH